MRQEYLQEVGAYVTRESDGAVREILHVDRPVASQQPTMQLAAREYLDQHAKLLGIPQEQLKRLFESPSDALQDAGAEFRFHEEKSQFDTTTVVYQQTYFGIPVWRAGLAVHLRRGPNRVLGMQSTAYSALTVARPKLATPRPLTDVTLRARLGVAPASGARARATATAPRVRIKSNRLVVYRYDAAKRMSDEGNDDHAAPLRERFGISLAAVPRALSDGTFVVAHEIIFDVASPGGAAITWLAIVAVESNAVLYLRPFTDNTNGLVFERDPLTQSGNAANSPAANAATLNPLRTSVTLQGLTAPVGGANQALTGEFIQVSDFELATAAPPTEAPGTNFDYGSRTNNFAAVNAYYHCDRFFRLVESLGFPRATYFDGTTFPVPVDHRGRFGTTTGIEINASCSGNGLGGIANVDFELANLADTTNPIGLAGDYRVVLHELGGHGILYDHVNFANFGFAHSAGDSFAAILNDPETAAPDRFLTFPWVGSVINRRHDRDVTAGWGWGGVNDTGGYNSESILATSHFRIYRSLGGDSTHLPTRQFAARVTAYLILRGVGNLSQPTNPGNVSGWVTSLLTADAGDWTSEGLAGGAYGKVIRWAFEKQGLFQPAGAPTPVVTAGAPPAVDVYIDDGRGGEYQWQPVHWNNQSVWNRRAADGGTTHEEPIVGQTNYAYVNVRNRGSQLATNVVVKGYHCNPGSGLTWPNDWQAMTTAQLSAANVPANNGGTITVGPFSWVPSQLDHECMLMIASAAGDPSNVDNFAPGESIAEWRLVKHDNNIGQRNVHPVAAGGLLSELIKSLHGRRFTVINPHRRPARVVLDVTLPPLLRKHGWKIGFSNPGGGAFSLEPGGRKLVTVAVSEGTAFGKEDVAALPRDQREIVIETVADGIVVGGMVYTLDPNISRATGQPGDGTPGSRDCAVIGERLLECLQLPGSKVSCVKVRKITVDIVLEDECC